MIQKYLYEGEEDKRITMAAHSAWLHGFAKISA